MHPVQGQYAVVTGASSGLGKAYAHRLASYGMNLILVARRQERLKVLSEELKSRYSIQAHTLALDLSQSGAAQQLYEQAIHWGHVTVLINNAGIGKYGPCLKIPYREHLATLHLNVIFPTEITYLFCHYMLEHTLPSYITQVASLAAFQSVRYFSIYSATKSYLLSFSETLGFELSKTNIHMMCLCPGGTWTEFFEQSGQTITSWGKHSMMHPDQVVHQAVQAMFNKKTIFVPGFLNQVACFLPRVFPRRFAQKLAANLHQRAVQSSLDQV